MPLFGFGSVRAGSWIRRSWKGWSGDSLESRRRKRDTRIDDSEVPWTHGQTEGSCSDTSSKCLSTLR